MTAFNIGDALGDPTITLYRGQTALATNDNWSTGVNATELAAAAAAVGTFALTTGSRDAALIATLPPGAYTAVLGGVGGTTGTATTRARDGRSAERITVGSDGRAP